MRKFEQTEQYQGGKPATYIYRGVKIHYSWKVENGTKIHLSEYDCPVSKDRISVNKTPQRIKGWIDLALDSRGVYAELTSRLKRFRPNTRTVIERAIERGYNVKSWFNEGDLCVEVSKGATARSKTLRFEESSGNAHIVNPSGGIHAMKSIGTLDEMLNHLGIPKLKN